MFSYKCYFLYEEIIKIYIKNIDDMKRIEYPGFAKKK